MAIFNTCRTLLTLIALVCFVFPNNLSAQQKGSFKIFSGEPRLLVVQGYSTSFHWPHLLKSKLDRHFNSTLAILAAKQF